MIFKECIIFSIIIIITLFGFIETFTESNETDDNVLPPRVYHKMSWRLSSNTPINSIIDHVEITYTGQKHIQFSFGEINFLYNKNKRQKFPFHIDSVTGIIYLKESIVNMVDNPFLVEIIVTIGELIIKNNVLVNIVNEKNTEMFGPPILSKNNNKNSEETEEIIKHNLAQSDDNGQESIELDTFPPILQINKEWRLKSNTAVGSIIDNVKAEYTGNEIIQFSLNQTKFTTDNDFILPFRIDSLTGTVFLNDSIANRIGENFSVYVIARVGKVTSQEEVNVNIINENNINNNNNMNTKVIGEQKNSASGISGNAIIMLMIILVALYILFFGY